jgi:hypothetical protein
VLRNIILALLIATIALLLLAYPFMWVWNDCVPQTFTGVHPLEYWRAFWLLVLLTVFIKAK